MTARGLDNHSQQLMRGFVRRLLDLGRAESTRRGCLQTARRFLVYAGGREIDQGMVDSFMDDVAARVDQNTWANYTHGLNALLDFMGDSPHFRPDGGRINIAIKNVMLYE